MDMDNLMQMADQLRKRFSSVQGETRNLKVAGEAGGGLVKVVLNGEHEALQVSIDRSVLGNALRPDDLKLLEDLVRAAFNQATARVVEAVKEQMGGLAKEFKIDPADLAGLGRPK